MFDDHTHQIRYFVVLNPKQVNPCVHDRVADAFLTLDVHEIDRDKDVSQADLKRLRDAWTHLIETPEHKQQHWEKQFTHYVVADIGCSKFANDMKPFESFMTVILQTPPDPSFKTTGQRIS